MIILQIRLFVIPMLLCVSLSSCTKLDSTVQSSNIPGGPGFPDQEVFGATVYYTRETQRRLVVSAPHISRFDGRRLLTMDGGVKVDFYDQFGAHQAIMTADEGELLELANRVWAKGNVIVRSDSGTVLRTAELRYDPDIQRVLTDGFVTIVTPQDSLSGYGFSSAPDLSDWEIQRSSGSTWRQFERRQETTQ